MRVCLTSMRRERYLLMLISQDYFKKLLRSLLQKRDFLEWTYCLRCWAKYKLFPRLGEYIKCLISTKWWVRNKLLGITTQGYCEAFRDNWVFLRVCLWCWLEAGLAPCLAPRPWLQMCAVCLCERLLNTPQGEENLYRRTDGEERLLQGTETWPPLHPAYHPQQLICLSI